MTEEEYSNLFNDSLTRCLADERFMVAFYGLFLDANEDIKQKFANTNFDHHHKMFEQSLYSIISVSEPNSASEQDLMALAHKHQDMDIKREHYDIWQDCLLKTVADFDPQFNEDIHQAWEHILKRGIDFMNA